ncbi:hypothetical protein AB0A73_21420 [Glycomyces sp. NPDC047369]
MTDLEQRITGQVIDTAGQRPGADRATAVEEFRAWGRARREGCFDCTAAVLDRAAADPRHGALVATAALATLFEQVGRALVRECLAREAAARAPFQAIVFASLAAADGGEVGFWDEAELVADTLEQLEAPARRAFLATVLDHAGFVCDEDRWGAILAGLGDDHLFYAYVEYVHAGGPYPIGEEHPALEEARCLLQGRHTRTPSRLEQDCYAAARDLGADEGDLAVLAGREDFGDVTRSRLDYCMPCMVETLGRASGDPVRAAVVAFLCLQVLRARVGSAALDAGMAYEPETARPYGAMIDRLDPDPFAHAPTRPQIALIGEHLAGLDEDDRAGFLIYLTHHAGFVCDEEQRFADQSGWPPGHPMRCYTDAINGGQGRGGGIGDPGGA